ncbi:MAG: hypothetical protein RJA49_1059, partial [Actinomycetota bacterium]
MPESAEFEQLTSLLDSAHLAGPDTLAAATSAAAAVLGWSARLYLIDYSQRVLVALPIRGEPDPAVEDVDATLPGRAFRTAEPVQSEAEDAARLWVPLLDGVERLGVVDVRFPLGTDVDSDALRTQVRRFVALVGHLVAAKNPYGDAFHRARSGGQRSVSSELIWALLPPLTMAGPDVVISGLLEPAEQVAGDVFDYAMQDGMAHVGMFDATGHDLHSSVIGSLALAAYRNGRRRGEPLSALAARIDTTLLEYAVGTYATGVMGE